MTQRTFGQEIGRDWLRELGGWKSDVCVCIVERRAGGIILQVTRISYRPLPH